jgi:heme A synthase
MTREQQILQLVHLLNNPWYALAFAVLVVWTIAWKGIALWKAARSNNSVWFIVLLLINTLGVLEILYVFFFSANKKEIK